MGTCLRSIAAAWSLSQWELLAVAGLVAGLCRCHSAWQRALGVLRRAAGPRQAWAKGGGEGAAERHFVHRSWRWKWLNTKLLVGL